MNRKRYFLGWVLGLLCCTSTLFAAPQFGGQSMIGELQSVLVKRPDQSFAVEDPNKWHYTSRPNLKKAQLEHDDFVASLKKEGVSVYYHDQFYPKLADSIYVHDPALLTDHGVVLLNMGKTLRQDEPKAIGEKFKSLGIPILGQLTGQATAEGGDMLWLDPKTLVVGRGYRTNDAGITQLRKILAQYQIEVIALDLPHDQGPIACLHLQSLISLVDQQVAVVYKKLMPVHFVQLLESRGFQLIDVPTSEYLTMATNILAIRPGVVLTIEGNPKTHAALKNAGVRVITYKGDEISHKAEGGATCLTRPLLRKV